MVSAQEVDGQFEASIHRSLWAARYHSSSARAYDSAAKGTSSAPGDEPDDDHRIFRPDWEQHQLWRTGLRCPFQQSRRQPRRRHGRQCSDLYTRSPERDVSQRTQAHFSRS